MDKLIQLRGEAGGSRDSTLDTTSPPSETFMTANESSSKFFSLSEVDTTFDISSIKDVSLASTTTDSEGTIGAADELISNLSPIGKKSDILDSYKIGKQIEAANILSGGVDIFEDNDNSYDGDELVIDDNVEIEDKSNLDMKQSESIEFKSDENIEPTLISEETDIASKDTEVVLQIDGKNVDAIDIGNGLYLYRKEGQEELAAVQIIDDDQQQPSFKFLKVRDNVEGNLEVYEEIEIEVPKEVPAKEGKTADKKISSHVPIKDINKVISDSVGNKVAERKNKVPRKEPISSTSELEAEIIIETSPDSKSEVNLNGKMMKFSESRKSPVIGSFTPMTYHSTPNKEGIPLTKTMVDQQLHPNRHSDNIKKTIEVHTDSCKQRLIESPPKYTDVDDNKVGELTSTEKEIIINETNEENKDNEKDVESIDIGKSNNVKEMEQLEIIKSDEKVSDDVCDIKDTADDICDSKNTSDVQMEQDNVIDSTEDNFNKGTAINKTDLPSEKVNEESIEEELKIISDDEESVKESMEIDNEILVKASQITGQNEANNEIHLKDSENLIEIDDIIEINEDVKEVIEPMQKDIKDKDKVCQKNNGNKTIEENAYNKQNETVIEKNIANETQDKQVGELIIIDDGEIVDTIIEQNTISSGNNNSNSKESVSENKKEENENVKNTESKYQEKAVVEIKNNDCSNVKKGVTNKNNDSITVCEPSQADSTSPIDIPDTQNKETKNEDAIVSLKVVKNNQSQILQLESNVVTNMPTGSELTVTKELSSKQVDSEQSKKPLTDVSSFAIIIPEEVVQGMHENTNDNVVGKKPLELCEKPIDIQQTSAAINKPQDKADVMLGFTHTSDITAAEMTVQKKVSNVLAKSPKKEPKTHIQANESQLKTNVDVDCSANVKLQASKIDQVLSGTVVSNKAENHLIQEKPQSASVVKPKLILLKDDKKEVMSQKVTVGEKEVTIKTVGKGIIAQDEPEPSTSADSNRVYQDIKNKNEPSDKNEVPTSSESKPNNNNNAAVPFGKWTATNRKEFLDKIKTRTPSAPTPSTSNQLKNSNDLNRRDVLKKIDSQRQSSSALAKTQEANKLGIKNETAFLSKTNIINKDNNNQESEIPLKIETEVTSNPNPALPNNAIVNEDVTVIPQSEPSQVASVTSVVIKKEATKRTAVNYQDLIDKTIEGMIHRIAPPSKVAQDELNQNAKDANTSQTVKYQQNYKPTDQATLDAIEMKMNELHGIPFIERPPHELPQVPIAEPKPFSKVEKEKTPAPIKPTKIPNLLPFANKSLQKPIKESIIEVDSEDEIIEHEPITGDIELNKKSLAVKPPVKEKLSSVNTEKATTEEKNKKEAIITEKDFDKFARRNSITYENCLTVNFDAKEQHNVIQNVKKDSCPKSYSRSDISREHQLKLPFKYHNVRQNIQPAKVQPNKFGSNTEDPSNRNQSKLQKAYQSALTAKRQLECPITIIEDKPVKVVFMDNMEFVPSQLNVQGQELSPAKKVIAESDNVTVSTCDSLDSDVMDAIDDTKSQDEVKAKTKHQRKQVLTPVEEPELELIEPKDLGIEMSPKKKRKTDEDKTDKNVKYPMRKKYYLLNSNAVTEEKMTYTPEVIKNPLKETVNRNDNGLAHKNAVSAIDSLVKAAELLEHQSENMNTRNSPNPDSQQSTPVKRGRGRPRKYPLPEGGTDKNKLPSPQKKPRLIDAKAPKRDTTTDDDDSDDGIIKENWTMGKINEKIVCPICNKLFRTENVVFKHVKHCTGPSPSRSDSDKRSPRRMRQSQGSDTKSRESQSDDLDLDDDKPLVIRKETPKKRKSRDSITKLDDKDEVIVIEDTPVKEKTERKEKEVDERKHHESRKPRAKEIYKNNALVCELCGKKFRQLSHLVSHQIQHKKDDLKKTEKDVPAPNKSVHGCEVCKKEFRKLHHLVQHRIIHNPSAVPVRSLRKSSSDQSNNKIEKEPNTSKQNEDTSAGFRCEPCDKSFRKLHHLVEHRETHDGINRQKTTTVAQTTVEKPVTLHQCDVCKKTFRKLHHLIEHKEQHLETSSEKSDDKSVKSSLSTRDIIHECSLCYMVFPNEHSLNKHTIICQRKKRQSKQTKQTEESDAIESVEDASECLKLDEKPEEADSPKSIVEEILEEHKIEAAEKLNMPKENHEAAKETPQNIIEQVEKIKENIPQKVEVELSEPQVMPTKREFIGTENNKTEAKPEVPEKIKKVDNKEATKSLETPKKKTPVKEKPAASKRPKTTTTTLSVEKVVNVKNTVESSDDDEVRYMLNPNFKIEDTAEEKVFMKVRAKKRSSLQIERPNSKDLVKRRTSLQHPPKIPRLKAKPVETNTVVLKNVVKTPKLETVSSTDSDDSETTKYSFPKIIPDKPTKPAQQDRTPKEIIKKTQKKLLSDKRKSLSGIAKRKSLGKAVTARHKPSPVKQIKRRTLEIEHRCDCGQLFSSAALLSRHTTLAHTPPRIRRRRSPLPEEKPIIKPAPRSRNIAEKSKQTVASRKSSARSDSSTSNVNTKPNKSDIKTTRKSLEKETKTPVSSRKLKPEKSEAKSSVKPRKTIAHRGVPVPEKMRKLMQKNNK